MGFLVRTPSRRNLFLVHQEVGKTIKPPIAQTSDRKMTCAWIWRFTRLPRSTSTLALAFSPSMTRKENGDLLQVRKQVGAGFCRRAFGGSRSMMYLSSLIEQADSRLQSKSACSPVSRKHLPVHVQATRLLIPHYLDLHQHLVRMSRS